MSIRRSPPRCTPTHTCRHLSGCLPARTTPARRHWSPRSARAAYLARRDDEAHGIPGLHEIRPKVELPRNDYLSGLGRDVVVQVQRLHGWFFTVFGYRIAPV